MAHDVSLIPILSLDLGSFRPKRSYGMGLSVCPCVFHTSTAVLGKRCRYMSKGNKRSQPERELEQKAKQALRTSVYIQSNLKRNLHREFYNLLIKTNFLRSVLCAMKAILYMFRIKFPVF